MSSGVGTLVAVSSVVVLTVVYLFMRRRHPSPYPARLAPLLSARWRWWFSPTVAANRHSLEPGLTTLEIGPGNGYLTGAALAVIGAAGTLVCLDIQMAMLRRLRAGLGGLTPPLVCASGSNLPFRAGSFDRIYMSHVLGEIPNRATALADYSRVLRADGILAVTEGLPDPDFIRRSALIGESEASGLSPLRHYGRALFYTQQFSLRRTAPR